MHSDDNVAEIRQIFRACSASSKVLPLEPRLLSFLFAERLPQRQATRNQDRSAPRSSLNDHYGGPEIGGLLPTVGCSGGDRPGFRNEVHPGEPFGEFGWPCAIGGSASVIQSTAVGTPLKSLVFYLPEEASVELRRVAWMLDSFRRALQQAVRLQPRLRDPHDERRIGLMNLAFDVEEQYVRLVRPDLILPPPTAAVRTIVDRLRLRGIAVIASEVEHVNHTVCSEDCGMYSPTGSLVVESVPVPFAWDLNRDVRFLNLHVVTLPSKWFLH